MASFDTYLAGIEKDLRGGKATELTYRSSLEELMESLARGINASSDPKHIECGAPDFIVERGRVPLGYVETKDIGEPLDRVEKSEQMKRYLPALHNLILTDYLEFRWYVNGERKLKARIADVGKGGKLIPNPQGAQVIEQLFRDFYATETPTVSTPKELATRLAGVTHFIRDQIEAALESGDPSVQKALQDQFTAFKDLLLPALKPGEFADLYAQAMTYGLFAAKLSAPEGEKFTLAGAYQFLFGNRFLRRLFSDVSEELDEIDIIRPYLQDVVSLLNRAHFNEILADFGKRTRTEDPVVHFYETFLSVYDPKLRESRGVYYTPEPVVQFIVNSVDELLKTRFDRPWGLADPSVKVLDPAAGTGTFLYYVIQKIHEEVQKRQQSGLWKQKSKDMLNRIFGFELLIAPYVVSHLKLGLLLKTLESPLEGRDERLHVFLTNTLEEGVRRAEQLAGMGHYIAEEASEAAQVKKQQDIMVVLGNPPYSNFGGLNKGKWILDLIQDYKKDLNERKINLDDDYIKFLRFGQWRINNSGQGVLAFITNNSFIDGLTHRQMRKSLTESFTDIYILNLHGSSKKQEIAPDGSRDENVFDIQQGVCISLFVKDPKKNNLAHVHYAELWGTRVSKYQILSNINLHEIKWEEIVSKKPFFYFVPRVEKNEAEYKNYWSLTDISQGISGIETKRDHLALDFDLVALKNRINDFVFGNYTDEQRKKVFDVRDNEWVVADAVRTLREDRSWQDSFKPCVYHPFDKLWIIYSPIILSRDRGTTMASMNLPNLGLIAARQTKESFAVLASDTICTHKIVTAYDRSFIFPLYLYTTPEETNGTLFAQLDNTRRPNLSPAFLLAFSKKLGLQFISDGAGDLKTTFGPEDVFHYAYAIFHSPTYRTRYAEFLKIDFPRLPLTSDKKVFRKLVEKGRELVDLHLLRTPGVDDFITTYPEPGNNRVEFVKYGNGRVSINPSQYFGGVPEAVWEFHVGGYQVCEKWLKDRKGRVLSTEDITHYQRVVVALNETIRLMKEIDAAIPSWPLM